MPDLSLDDIKGILAQLSGGGQDRLVAPPANPMAPPDSIMTAVRGALKHNMDWASVPGRVMQGVQPQTPGQWSEEDQFRADHLNRTADQFGPQTAFSEVFWPRTGTNVGGSGFAVGSGAMSPRANVPMHPDVPVLKGKLEDALKSKEFPQVFETLKDLPIEVLKPLAKEFFGGPAAKSTKQALETIWSRWRKLQEFENE